MNIRNAEPIGLKGDYHPFAKKSKTSAPIFIKKYFKVDENKKLNYIWNETRSD